MAVGKAGTLVNRNTANRMAAMSWVCWTLTLSSWSPQTSGRKQCYLEGRLWDEAGQRVGGGGLPAASPHVLRGGRSFACIYSVFSLFVT